MRALDDRRHRHERPAAQYRSHRQNIAKYHDRFQARAGRVHGSALSGRADSRHARPRKSELYSRRRAGRPRHRAAAIRNLHIQGALTNTGNKLDVALNGRGWFQVSNAAGEQFYTRTGAFNKSATGQLVTSDGYTFNPGSLFRSMRPMSQLTNPARFRACQRRGRPHADRPDHAGELRQ